MKSVVWVVREGDGANVGAIVSRAGGDAKAIGEGRVFVGRTRARDASDAVRVGDEVSIRAAGSIASMLTILHREADFVAIAKAAGIPTIADHAGAAHSLVALVAKELRVAEAKVHPTSRLDREVSGVVIFALTPAAAERFKKAREAHTYHRRYVAIAANAPSPEQGTWDAPIGRAKDARHRAVNGRDAIAARTHYAVASTVDMSTVVKSTMLALTPITGRTHQLRVHAAHAGAPLLGDRVYGAPPRITLANGRIYPFERIALHAARVTVPAARAPVTLDAPIPSELRDLWLSLGGDDSAWDRAVAWSLPNT